MSSGHFCSVCRAGYRSGSSVHLSTARHKRSVHAAETRITGRGRDLDKGLGYRRPNIRRALAGDTGEDHEKVRSYRRRLPLDGPKKVVKVDRYWRRRVQRVFEFEWRPGKKNRRNAA